MRINVMMMIRASRISCLLHLLLLFDYSNSQPSISQNDIKSDWANLKASPNLTWHKCYSSIPEIHGQHIIRPRPSRTLSCARLTVPLEYHNASNTQSVDLALLKISTPPKPSHRGTITFVPGGAGETRIKISLALESSGLMDMLDPNFEYDFVTFDNRGTGYSFPKAECFDSILESKLWDVRLNDLGGVTSTEDHFGNESARTAGAFAIGKMCAEASGKERDVRRHLSTAYIARDLLEILYKIEEEREPKESLRRKPKIQFIGMSYGTMVGQTFASMYPQHVSRMLLDGAVDAYDWTGKWQMEFLRNVEILWSSFFTDCFEVNKSCPLWRVDDKEAVDMRRRVESWMKGLKHSPVYTISDGVPRFITYRDAKWACFIATYRAADAFKPLAEMLDKLIRGYTNVTLTFPFENGDLSSPVGEDDVDLWADINTGAGVAINCADGEDISEIDPSIFREYISALEKQSPLASSFQAERRLRCIGWPNSEKTVWRYAGPFEANLTIPILYIGSSMDPATPLSNSFRMAKGFPGSVVVEQRSRSHCTLFNAAPNPCSIKLIREYFTDGILPKEGTVCGTYCNAFDGSCDDVNHVSTASKGFWG